MPDTAVTDSFAERGEVPNCAVLETSTQGPEPALGPGANVVSLNYRVLDDCAREWDDRLTGSRFERQMPNGEWLNPEDGAVMVISVAEGKRSVMVITDGPVDGIGIRN